MNVYLDTSALIKLILLEDGSEVADELWDRADIAVSCRLFYPEARAALAMARREGRIDQRTLRRAVRDLDALGEEIGTIEVDASLAIAAGELAERHSLRGYDAVHLAAALAVQDNELVLATWDRDLARAAVAEGRVVVPDR